MIKEIEVGGVKYSITLADDMVGSGLKRDADGRVGVNIGASLIVSPSFGTLEVDTYAICGSGLLADEHKLNLNIESLAGSGLVAIGGKLAVVGGGGSVVAGSLAGSGLRSIEGNKLALALSGSNLLKFGPNDTLDINLLQLSGSGLMADGDSLRINVPDLVQDYGFLSGLASNLSGSGLFVFDGKLTVSGGSVDVNALCGSGLEAFDGKLYLNPRIAGSGLIYDINNPVLDVNINRHSGLAYDYSTGSSPLGINIAKRTYGLRLFFNSYGELDVIQD